MFKFKEFTIIQESSPLKFGTDSMIVGGLTRVYGDEKMVLDIGSGCGIIALLLAQRCNANIDAVEINSGAFHDLTTNFKESSWKKRLHGYQTDLNTFSPSETYDLIVSNPPYFANSLKSDNVAKMNARHNEALTANEILLFAKNYLNMNGRLSIIYPTAEADLFLIMAQKNGFNCSRIIEIKSFKEGETKRKLLEFSKEAENFNSEELVIYQSKGVYTKEYRSMLSKYFVKI